MKSDPRDYRLEISSLGQPTPPPAGEAKKWLSVMFACCSAYARVYQNNARTAYEGRCPRCARRVRFIIGPGGTNCRQFVVE